MPRGAKPGERRGGRYAGVPNKKTIAKALAAERTIVEARQSGREMAVDVLEKFMHLFAGMAATYQPLSPRSPAQNEHEDRDLFDRYARLAIETAADLAKYQSPTFKAIAMHMATPGDNAQTVAPTAQVIDINDPQRLMRVYQKMLVASKR